MIETQLTAFDAYVARTLPPQLREGSPPPPTWEGAPDEWEGLAAAARRSHREKATFDFARAISVLGFYADELGTGELRPGAKVEVATGRVVRPEAPETTPALEQRAQELLGTIARENVTVDAVILSNLTSVAMGLWHGGERVAEDSLRAAEAEVNFKRKEVAAAIRPEAEQAVLQVRFPFRAQGKHWAPGQYKIDQAEAEALADWQSKMEATARVRRWEAPEGFTPATWPPFTISK